MKQSPYLRKIVERMAPGVLSKDGFLGDDPRPLAEILDADRSTVVGLDSSHEELAEQLYQVFLQARSALGGTIRINKNLTAVHREAMGRIPCPWGQCATFPKGQVELSNTSTGQRMIFTALGVHMVADHGFYQGRGSAYRLEPEDIHDLFRTAGPS